MTLVERVGAAVAVMLLLVSVAIGGITGYPAWVWMCDGLNVVLVAAFVAVSRGRA